MIGCPFQDAQWVAEHLSAGTFSNGLSVATQHDGMVNKITTTPVLEEMTMEQTFEAA